MLWEAIGCVVDDHRCRAGARRMSAALAAGREDGFIVGEPGAGAVMVVPAHPEGEGVAPWELRLQFPIVG
jgi:hypothetical protein